LRALFSLIVHIRYDIVFISSYHGGIVKKHPYVTCIAFLVMAIVIKVELGVGPVLVFIFSTYLLILSLNSYTRRYEYTKNTKSTVIREGPIKIYNFEGLAIEQRMTKRALNTTVLDILNYTFEYFRSYKYELELNRREVEIFFVNKRKIGFLKSDNKINGKFILQSVYAFTFGFYLAYIYRIFSSSDNSYKYIKYIFWGSKNKMALWWAFYAILLWWVYKLFFENFVGKLTGIGGTANIVREVNLNENGVILRGVVTIYLPDVYSDGETNMYRVLFHELDHVLYAFEHEEYKDRFNPWFKYDDTLPYKERPHEKRAYEREIFWKKLPFLKNSAS